MDLKNDLSLMNKEIDKILEPWFKYIKENKGDLNYFGKLLTKYIKEIHCYDFFYTNKEVTINKIKEYSL